MAGPLPDLRALALPDLEPLAAQRLDAATWAYLDGGAADERTKAANRAAWASLWLRPRVLRRTAGGSTAIELLGRRWPTPLLAAPMAYQRLAHADGELATALAAAAQGAGMVLSAQASVPLETVAAAVRDEVQRGPLWFQLYLQADREDTLELVRRAEAAGYEALVLTVDAPVHGVRDREWRAGFRLPAGIAAVNLPTPAGRPQRDVAAGGSRLFDDLLHDAPTWDDLAWLLAQTRLPLLVKGVLHADDARAAVDCGVAGVVVSNHGGRTLDTALPTAWALPAVVDAVAHDVPVLVDGGLRRGTDVLKALALGARAVFVGRPLLHALACGGAQGVAHAVRRLRDELEAAMALVGAARPAELARELVVRGPGSAFVDTV